MHDLLTDQRYTWRGSHNYVIAAIRWETPAHILFGIERDIHEVDSPP